jgi:hypothetical protein
VENDNININEQLNNNNLNINNNINNNNNSNPNINNLANPEKNFTNNGSNIKTNSVIKNIINSNNDNNNNDNNYNNNNNDSYNIDNIIDENEEEDYSYDCTNSMYLSVYIYEGTEEVQFEIFLKNNGNKTWANDSKLIIDPSSSFVTDVVLLAQQKPNEERSYKITIKNLGKYPDGEHKVIFLFYCGGKIRGEKITALVKIREKDNKKSEIEEYSDKISEFRETFNLSEDEYPDEKILEILKDNEFNFENAFSSLFN